jgi:hypothetical protein
MIFITLNAGVSGLFDGRFETIGVMWRRDMFFLGLRVSFPGVFGLAWPLVSAGVDDGAIHDEIYVVLELSNINVALGGVCLDVSAFRIVLP